jgi:cholesterol transport system auxiliary component
MNTGCRACPRLRVLIAAFSFLILAACAFERPTSDVPTAYDLGPAPSYTRANPGVPGTLLVVPVRAPAWLDESGIVYRLLYDDASRPRAYATSRWSAPPPSLLTDRIYSRFAAASKGVVAPGFSARSDYTIRVELEDFSQHFTTPTQSRVRLKARASFLSSETRELLAQKDFDIERAAEPNAVGAVRALTAAADEFAEALVKWTAENAHADSRNAQPTQGKAK